MFLEQGIKPENKFWKYLLGSVFIITASFVGQIPLSAAVFYKTFTENQAFPTHAGRFYLCNRDLESP